MPASHDDAPRRQPDSPGTEPDGPTGRSHDANPQAATPEPRLESRVTECTAPASTAPASTAPESTVPESTAPARPHADRETAAATAQPTGETSGGGWRRGTIFQLCRDLARLPDDLELRNVEWGVLFAVTGEHTVAQIGEHFQLERGEERRIFCRLVEKGLVAERPVSYGEYLRAAATVRDDEPKTLARFLRAGVVFGPPARVAGAPRPAQARGGAESPPNAPVPPRAGSPRAGSPQASSPRPEPTPTGEEIHQTRAIPTFRRDQVAAFQPLGQPAAPPSSPSAPTVTAPAATAATATSGSSFGSTSPPPIPTPRQLSLKRVMQFILDRAPDLNAGQLDIYRVFIRVNTRLLRRNGIDTLRFEEDRLVADPELQRAITASLEKTLGLSCPDDVYLAA